MSVVLLMTEYIYTVVRCYMFLKFFNNTDAMCNFENGSQCIWQNVNLGDDFDWILHRSKTPSDDTGPNVEHTFGNETGMHLSI